MLKISYRKRKKNKESAREQEKVRYLGEHTFDVHCTRASTMPRHMSAATVPSTADTHSQNLKHIHLHRFIHSNKQQNYKEYVI